MAVGGGFDFFGEGFIEAVEGSGFGGVAFDEDAGDGADVEGEFAADGIEEVGVGGAGVGGGGRGGGGDGAGWMVEGGGVGQVDEGVGEFEGGREAVFGAFGEGAEDGLPKGFGDLGVFGARGFGGGFEVAGEDGVFDVAGEGRAAGGDFPKGDGGGIDVGAGIEGFTADLFGGHVLDGADDGSGLGEAVVAGDGG